MSYATATSVFAIAIAVAVAPLCSEVLRRWRVPSVLFELLLGIVIGPEVLHWASLDQFVTGLSALGLCFLFGRYWLAVPVLAIAGSLARKKIVPAGAGTLPTHTPLFVALLVGVVILVGALTFIPALALGPIVEHLLMLSST